MLPLTRFAANHLSCIRSRRWLGASLALAAITWAPAAKADNNGNGYGTNMAVLKAIPDASGNVTITVIDPQNQLRGTVTVSLGSTALTVAERGGGEQWQARARLWRNCPWGWRRPPTRSTWPGVSTTKMQLFKLLWVTRARTAPRDRRVQLVRRVRRAQLDHKVRLA